MGANDLAITTVEDGVMFHVRVLPRSSRTIVDGVHNQALRVRLKAPPVDGAANKALCEFLSKSLGVRKRDVEIVRGERSRTKHVLVRGISPNAVLDMLR